MIYLRPADCQGFMQVATPQFLRHGTAFIFRMIMILNRTAYTNQRISQKQIYSVPQKTTIEPLYVSH